MTSPYDVLGVAPTASAEEIRRAYVRLARTHHPDVVAPEERDAAEQRMRAINEAWAVLGSAERRAAVDDEAARTFRPFSGGADDPDPRHQPDRPYRPVAPALARRAGAIRTAPVGLFAASVATGVLALVIGGPALWSVAVVLFILSCVSVLLVALVTLAEATRDEG